MGFHNIWSKGQSQLGFIRCLIHSTDRTLVGFNHAHQ